MNPFYFGTVQKCSPDFVYLDEKENSYSIHR